MLVLTALLALCTSLRGAEGYMTESPHTDVPPPIVETDLGSFIGKHMVSGRQKREIFAFTGIPYAKPPVGERRFEPPEAVGPHSGPYRATSPSPECVQWDHLRMRGLVGQEDCLYLDIYTNVYPGHETISKKKSQQPIVVMLHAGSYLAGSGASDLFTPDYLIENDVMMVNINHRLGAMGFLSTEDADLSGNFGIRDVIAALEWIRTHSWHFGGTNETLTLMGSGAGGTTTHLLTLSPLAWGDSIHNNENKLMARAISHSGTAYTPHAIARDAKAQAFKLALLNGCPPQSSSAELKKCLQKVPADTLIGQTPSLFTWDEEPLPFGPVIDSWMGANAVLPDEPFHIIHAGNVMQIPWLAGLNKDDGAFRVQDILEDASLVTQLNKDWDRYGPVMLHLTKESCLDPVAISRQIRDRYMKGRPFGEHSGKEFVEMMTDRFFVYPTIKAMRDHCAKVHGHYTWCYQYVLEYSGRKSFLDVLHHENKKDFKSTFGVSNPRFAATRDIHGYGVGFMDEMLYLFPSPALKLLYQQETSGDAAQAISNAMIMFWTNFMKGGDPTPLMKGMPDDISPWGAWWEPFVPGYDIYLRIDPEMESQEAVYKKDAIDFWDALPLYENRDRNVLRDEL